MRAWQLLACLALFVAVSSAFTVSLSHVSHEGYDLEPAESKGHHHESGFEESGGSEHGGDHHSKVS